MHAVVAANRKEVRITRVQCVEGGNELFVLLAAKIVVVVRRRDDSERDVVQTVYMRRVERAGDRLVNVEFEKYENVKDPAKARAK